MASGRARMGKWGLYGVGVGLAVLFGWLVPRGWDPYPRVLAAALETAEYRTQRGERATLELPDGSRVVLAPETRLHYQATRRGGRIVQLAGQAYFSVAADENRPFSVRTTKVVTRVLGTTFSVRTYETDRIAHVAVAEGKVAIGTGAQTPTTILLPGDVGHVTPGQSPVVTSDSRIIDVFGWMRGQLVFDDTPLRDIVLELERVYNLRVTLANPALAERRFTGTFETESVDDVLSLVSLGVDATYARQGTAVVFSAK